MNLRPGWFERVSRQTHNEMREWPEWMREGSSVDNVHFYTLVKKIHTMHAAGMMHKRRGFSLSDVTPMEGTNHLIEEAVEFQAEIMCKNKERATKEAADALACLLSTLFMADISIHDVIDTCDRDLDANFTNDEAELETDTPGFSRSHRKS